MWYDITVPVLAGNTVIADVTFKYTLDGVETDADPSTVTAILKKPDGTSEDLSASLQDETETGRYTLPIDTTSLPSGRYILVISGTGIGPSLKSASQFTFKVRS